MLFIYTKMLSAIKKRHLEFLLLGTFCLMMGFFWKEHLRLQNIVDQTLFIGFSGIELKQGTDIYKILHRTNVGGVILSDYDTATGKHLRNIVDKEQVVTLIKNLQGSANTPLFIGIDQEGGLVSRLGKTYGFQTFSSATDLGSQDISVAMKEYKEMSLMLDELGINVNFAPVLDLKSATDSAPMTMDMRVYSDDPAVVAAFGRMFIQELRSHDILAVAKHYPGLGDAYENTHNTLPIQTAENKNSILPYVLLNDEQMLDIVMMGHILNTSVDSLLPASLSKKNIDALRTKVGFKGLIITDDLEMKSITNTYSIEDAAVKALQAGNDMILLSSSISFEEFLKIRNAIMKAIRRGDLSEERVLGAYQNIIDTKIKAKIIASH